MTKEERAEQKRIEAEKQQKLAQEFVARYKELCDEYGLTFEGVPYIDSEGRTKAQLQITLMNV